MVFIFRPIYMFHRWLDNHEYLKLGFALFLSLVLPLSSYILTDGDKTSGIPLIISVLLLMTLGMSRIPYIHGSLDKYKPKPIKTKLIDIWNRAEKLYKENKNKKALSLYKKFLRLNKKSKSYKEDTLNERIESIEKILFREERLKRLLKSNKRGN